MSNIRVLSPTWRSESDDSCKFPRAKILYLTLKRNTTFGEKYKAIKIDRGVELPGFGVTSKE